MSPVLNNYVKVRVPHTLFTFLTPVVVDLFLPSGREKDQLGSLSGQALQLAHRARSAAG